MQPSSWCPALVSREKRGETSSPPGTFVIWRNRCIYWIRNTSTESVGATIDFRYRILPLNLTTTYIQLHLALDCSKQFDLLFVYNLKKSWPSISLFFYIRFSCIVSRNFIFSSFQDLYMFHYSISWIEIQVHWNQNCGNDSRILDFSLDFQDFKISLLFVSFIFIYSFSFISLFISHNCFIKFWFFKIEWEQHVRKLN